MIVDKFVARQPILNNSKKTVAYELLFRNSTKNCYPLDVGNHQATRETIYNSFLEIGINEISGGKDILLNIDEKSLHDDLIFSLNKDLITLEILETVEPTSKNILRLKKLKSKGFRIALDDFDLKKENKSLVQYCDLVKIDIQATSWKKIERDVKIYKSLNKKILAEKVETNNEYERCKNLKFDYYQGYFFSTPELLQSKKIRSQQQIVLLSYKSLISEESYGKIAEIISKDLGLSEKFLRYTHDIMAQKRKRCEKVTSVFQALCFIGHQNTKHFFNLAMIELFSDDKPDEVGTISFIRGRFLQLLFERNGRDWKEKAHLTGFFSLLDVLLSQDLQEVIPKLNLHEDIENAIMYKDGELGSGLKLVQAIENFDYEGIEKHSTDLEINVRDINTLYQKSIKWHHEIMI